MGQISHQNFIQILFGWKISIEYEYEHYLVLKSTEELGPYNLINSIMGYLLASVIIIYIC